MKFEVETTFESFEDGHVQSKCSLLQRTSRSKKIKILTEEASADVVILIPIEMHPQHHKQLEGLYQLFWNDDTNTSVAIELLLEEMFLAGMEFQKQRSM